MSVKILQIHKRSSYQFRHIQDKYAFSENEKCYAIADGTTQSLNSELWAEILTTNFVKKPNFEITSFIKDLQVNASKFKEIKFTFSPKMAIASIEKTKLAKGATATFIGSSLNKNKELSIISAGDSNVFIYRNNQFRAYPFTSVEMLDNNKTFLNTESIFSNIVDEIYFQKTVITIQANDVVILATDALSRLLFQVNSAFDELLAITNFDALLQFCLNYWDRRLLEEDDVTALIIHDFNSNEVQEILPPNDFSFPKDEEIVFTPTIITKEPFHKINHHEMQELRNSLNSVHQDVIVVKQKSKVLEMFLMIIISLVAINISLLFYLKPSNAKVDNKVEQLLQQKLDEKEAIISNKEAIISQNNQEIKRLNSLIPKIVDSPLVQKQSSIVKPKQATK